MNNSNAAQTAATLQAAPQHPTESPKWLGETPAFWVQTAVLLLGAIFAYLAIRSSRAIERRKAAAEVIFSSRRDEELRKAVRHIATLHEGDQNIARFAKKEHMETDDSKLIRYALNHYEYISVGIAEGIYDERMFQNSSHSTVMKLYNRTKPFIDEARAQAGSQTIFQDFECLACRWREKPLKPKKIKIIQAR